MSFFISLYNWLVLASAWAQDAAAPAAPAAKPSLFEQLTPVLFFIALIYFLMIRPQQKRAATHQKVLSELKRGDSVLTSGGILGTIEGLTEKFVTLKIADDVRIRILRSQIAGPTQEDAKP
jgi:preprotein translocase subunit YajC